MSSESFDSYVQEGPELSCRPRHSVTKACPSPPLFPSHCTSTSAGHKGGCPGWIHLGVEHGIKDEGPCHHTVYQSSTRQDASGDMRAALLQGDVSISVVRVLVPAGRKV